MLAGTEAWGDAVRRQADRLGASRIAARELARSAGFAVGDDDEMTVFDAGAMLRAIDMALACGEHELGLALASGAEGAFAISPDPDRLCLAAVLSQAKVTARPSGVETSPSDPEIAPDFFSWPNPGKERARLVLATVATAFLQQAELSPLSLLAMRQTASHPFSKVELASLAMTAVHAATFPNSIAEFAAEPSPIAADVALQVMEWDWARRVAMLRADSTSWALGRPRARVFDWSLIAILVGRLERGADPIPPPLNDDVQQLRSIAEMLAANRGLETPTLAWT